MKSEYRVNVKMDMGPFEFDGKAISVVTADDIKKAEIKGGEYGLLGTISGLFGSAGGETREPEGVEQGLRGIAVGLECYYIDHNRYPKELDQLITPVAYLSAIPRDTYGSEGNDELRYGTDGTTKWILQSRGPDGNFDMDLQLFLDSTLGPRFITGTNPGAKYVYDPTNGTGSDGDIMRTGP